MLRRRRRMLGDSHGEDPMAGSANLVDAMLVLAVGFLIFLVMSWNMQNVVFADMSQEERQKTMEAMNTQQSTDSLYRHYQSRTASETEGEENYDNTESQSSQDIYSSVKDLFEKYDMEGY